MRARSGRGGDEVGRRRLTLDIDEYRERCSGASEERSTRSCAIVQRAKSAQADRLSEVTTSRCCAPVRSRSTNRSRAHPARHEKKIRQRAAELDLDLEGVEIINPPDSPRHAAYATEYLALRCRKGVTASNATRLVNRRIHFGMMMVRTGDADGLVASLTSPTPTPFGRRCRSGHSHRRAARHRHVHDAVEERREVLRRRDVNIDPDAATLADTAIRWQTQRASSRSRHRIVMISFSNFGSAHHQNRRRWRRRHVRRLAHRLCEIDGAVHDDIDRGVQSRCASWCRFPASRDDVLAVLIFPRLSASNAA